MARTYKRMPYRGCGFRNTHGRRQALINKARPKAVPPDPWEDIPVDNQCYLPMRIALKLHQKGMDNVVIVKHLRRKFKLSLKQAEGCVSWDGYWWQCECEECNRVRKEGLRWRLLEDRR